MFCLASDDVAECHARTGGTSSLGDGSAVQHNRFFLGSRNELQGMPSRYTYFQPFHIIIKWQVNFVFKTLCSRLAIRELIIGVGNRIAESISGRAPIAFAVDVGSIHIYSRYTGGWHVWHTETTAHLITDFDLRCIATESDGHAGTMSGQIPYRFSDKRFGLCWKTIVRSFQIVLPCLSTDYMERFVHRVLPLHFSLSGELECACKASQ